MSVKPKRPSRKRKPYPWKQESRELQLMLLKATQERNAYQKQIAQHMNELVAAEADKRILLDETLKLKEEVMELSATSIEDRAFYGDLDAQLTAMRAERDALAQQVEKLKEWNERQAKSMEHYEADLAETVKLRAYDAEQIEHWRRDFFMMQRMRDKLLFHKPWYRRGFDFVLARFGICS